MKRRLCLLAMGIIIAIEPNVSWTQQTAKAPVVGVLVTHAAVNDTLFENLRVGLREFGYDEPRNIGLEISAGSIALGLFILFG